MDDTVIYNRGLLQAAMHVEAIRNALKLNGGKQPTGERRQEGLRADQRLYAGRAGAAARRSPPEDHEGGGWVQIFQVKGGKFVKEDDWFRAYRDVVEKAVAGQPERPKRAGVASRCWRSTISKSSMTA